MRRALLAADDLRKTFGLDALDHPVFDQFLTLNRQ
jgi:hypothetical protein